MLGGRQLCGAKNSLVTPRVASRPQLLHSDRPPQFSIATLLLLSSKFIDGTQFGY